jgi:hypothetical protein
LIFFGAPTSRLTIRCQHRAAASSPSHTQASAPLPGNADGAIALLGEAALVDDQRAGRLATQQAVGIPGDLLDHRLVPPRGVANEMLELLCATLVNHGGHSSERGLGSLREAMQVALCHRRAVPRPGAKERTVAVDETREGAGDAIDQRCGQPSAAHTVTRRIDGVISPSRAEILHSH